MLDDNDDDDGNNNYSFILLNMTILYYRLLGNRLVVLCPFPNVCDNLW